MVLHIFTCCFTPVDNPSYYRKTCCERLFGIHKEVPTKLILTNTYVPLQKEKLSNLNASKIHVQSLSCKPTWETASECDI